MDFLNSLGIFLTFQRCPSERFWSRHLQGDGMLLRVWRRTGLDMGQCWQIRWHCVFKFIFCFREFNTRIISDTSQWPRFIQLWSDLFPDRLVSVYNIIVQSVYSCLVSSLTRPDPSYPENAFDRADPDSDERWVESDLPGREGKLLGLLGQAWVVGNI